MYLWLHIQYLVDVGMLVWQTSIPKTSTTNKKIYNFLIYQEHQYGFHNHPTNKNVFNVTSLMMNNINAVSTNINLLLLLFWLFIL